MISERRGFTGAIFFFFFYRFLAVERTLIKLFQLYGAKRKIQGRISGTKFIQLRF